MKKLISFVAGLFSILLVLAVPAMATTVYNHRYGVDPYTMSQGAYFGNSNSNVKLDYSFTCNPGWGPATLHIQVWESKTATVGIGGDDKLQDYSISGYDRYGTRLMPFSPYLEYVAFSFHTAADNGSCSFDLSIHN